MEIVKRLIPINNLSGALIATLRLRVEDFLINGVSDGFINKGETILDYSHNVKTTLTVIDGGYKLATFLLFDGENYYVLNEENYFYNVSLKQGFSVCCVDGGQIVGKALFNTDNFYEQGFLDFFRRCNGGVSTVYDDDKIAEDNYFLKEGFYEKQSYHHDDIKRSNCQKQNKKSGGPQTFYDAPNLYDKQKFDIEKCADCANERGNFTPSQEKKWGYKPENESFSTDDNQKLLSKDKYSQFKKITCDKQQVDIFKDIFINSKFYFFDQKKPFYLGAIFLGDAPSVFIYAFPSKNCTLKGGYFVPKSYFDDTDGFYCLFQSVT